jgi:hypothetical protein
MILRPLMSEHDADRKISWFGASTEKELRRELRRELRQELRRELRRELCRELRRELRREMRQELRPRINFELIQGLVRCYITSIHYHVSYLFSL